ncbi:sporulation kinase E [bacterium BMS3Abin10]|nr:sporulation kinase E [bacterium BMS3Abin10]GBE38788.1 sporulation kinase E [bacterium BMS3Bbin08]HDH49970.1 PAS domain S-box protein [Nitrospirota bacterium]HDK17100.1 PAS domain S-box protein [Nitrospirota bacterium]
MRVSKKKKIKAGVSKKTSSSKKTKKTAISKSPPKAATGKARKADKSLRVDYYRIIDNSPVGAYITNLKGDIIYVNKTLAKMLEFKSPEEMIKEGVLVRYKDLNDRKALIDELKKNGKVVKFEVELLTKSGNVRDMLLSAVIKDNTISGMLMDITERKASKDAIIRGKVEWEMTFDSATDLIALVDKDLNIVRCNRSFAKYAGLPIKELIGCQFCEFLQPADAEQFAQCKALIRAGELLSRVEVNTGKGDWFYISSKPITDHNGKFLHTVVIATDIGELKKIQQKLVSSEKELKKKLAELEVFYNIAIGRELKMKSLKREIKELRKKVSQQGTD